MFLINVKSRETIWIFLAKKQISRPFHSYLGSVAYCELFVHLCVNDWALQFVNRTADGYSYVCPNESFWFRILLACFLSIICLVLSPCMSVTAARIFFDNLTIELDMDKDIISQMIIHLKWLSWKNNVFCISE